MTHDGRTARSQMFGRKVRPLSFWMGYFAFVLTVGVLAEAVTGTLLNGIVGHAHILPAVVVLGALAYGFWARNVRTMTWGLLLSTGLWGSVAFFALVDTWNTSISGYIAIGLAGLCGWSWWIEVDDGREGRNVGGLESGSGCTCHHVRPEGS